MSGKCVFGQISWIRGGNKQTDVNKDKLNVKIDLNKNNVTTLMIVDVEIE